MLELLRHWATELNDKNKAGALIEVTNDYLVLRISNKKFTPFISKLKINDGGGVSIYLAEHYNYGANLKDVIYGNNCHDPLKNYSFSEFSLTGFLSNDFELISKIISHAANKFFDQSDFFYNEITATKTPII